MYLPGILGTRCRTSNMAKFPLVAGRTGLATVSADGWPYIVSVCSGICIPRDFWSWCCCERSSFNNHDDSTNLSTITVLLNILLFIIITPCYIPAATRGLKHRGGVVKVSVHNNIINACKVGMVRYIRISLAVRISII